MWKKQRKPRFKMFFFNLIKYRQLDKDCFLLINVRILTKWSKLFLSTISKQQVVTFPAESCTVILLVAATSSDSTLYEVISKKQKCKLCTSSSTLELPYQVITQ